MRPLAVLFAFTMLAGCGTHHHQTHHRARHHAARHAPVALARPHTAVKRHGKLRFTLTGPPSIGQTLFASTGTWANVPTSFAYQWQHCDSAGANCVNITGATSSSYVVVAGDSGFSLRVVVTAANPIGSASTPSAATQVVSGVPVNTGLPVITGTTTQGQTLSATNGTWTGSPTSFTRQWRDCDSAGNNCADITGATSSTYTLQASDVNHTIRVVVTAVNATGSSLPATSNQTAVIAASSGGGGSSAPIYNPPACTQTATTSTYVSAVTNAAGGAVVCLSAGTYAANEWISLNKSSRVTIQPSPGATVHLGNVKLTGATNLTWQGFSSLNGSSDSDGLTLQGQFAGADTNITWTFNSSATAGVAVNTNPVPNANILVQNNKFVGFTSSGEQDRVLINAQNGSTCPTGITISFNLMANGEADGTDIDGGTCGVAILHNEYANINTANCNGIHCDPIQDNGGGSQEDIEGNYFHGDSTGLLFDDGNGPGAVIYKNNVCDNPATAQGCIQGQYADSSVFDHNTVEGHYNFADLSQRGGQVGNPGSTNLTFTNNAMASGADISYFPATSCCSYRVLNFNVHQAGAYGGSFPNGPNDKIGTPTFVGGAEPSTWAGWALTTSSLGHLSASDGTDIGANLSISPGPSW